MSIRFLILKAQNDPGVKSRHGRMAAARLCAQAWLSPHIIHINRGQRLIEIILSVRGRGQLFSLFYVSSNFKTQLFSKIDGHFLGTSCFVIANLGRLAAAKMRLSINCIEFAYSRPIVYPRPCLFVHNQFAEELFPH